MYYKIKKRVFEIMQPPNEGDRISHIFDLFIILLIVINAFMVIAETFTLSESVKVMISRVETASVIIFTIEYILRLWTSNLIDANISPIKARLRYIFSFMAIIDLLAILPFYVPFLIPIDLRVLRMLRVIRILRLFKINRYTNALSTIGNVFKRKASQLISAMLVIALLMIITSVLMYNIESTAQPDKFTNAFSGLWWSIVTLTTVGYGDIYPITTLGKLLGSVIAFLGIGLVAVPTGIISAGFMETIDENEEKDKKSFCPYCGHKLDE